MSKVKDTKFNVEFSHVSFITKAKSQILNIVVVLMSKAKDTNF